MEETIRNFKQHLAKMDAYHHAFGVLNYDSETVMPKGGSAHLGMTYGCCPRRCTSSPPARS